LWELQHTGLNQSDNRLELLRDGCHIGLVPIAATRVFQTHSGIPPEYPRAMTTLLYRSAATLRCTFVKRGAASASSPSSVYLAISFARVETAT